MADDPHATAVLDLLRADTLLTVYDGVVGTDPPSAYVCVYFARYDDITDQLTMPSDSVVLRVYTHSVAETSMGARIVAGRVRAALMDVRPVVPGRITWPIRHEATVPPMRDESLGVAVIDMTDTYVLRTQA